MEPKTKVRIVGGANARRGTLATVTSEKGTGKNAGKIQIYIERSDKGYYWYHPDELEIIEKPPESPKIVSLQISQIRRDGGTQVRVKIERATVEEYAEDMKGDANFPPIIVFKDPDGNIWLSDGFHRIEAAELIGRKEIEAELRIGTLRDAILYSCGANAKHGLRRTNADKKSSVLILLNDPDWREWSNVSVALACGVSEGLVRRIKKESHFVQNEVRKYRTKHGTTSSMDTSKIGIGSEPNAAKF